MGDGRGICCWALLLALSCGGKTTYSGSGSQPGNESSGGSASSVVDTSSSAQLGQGGHSTAGGFAATGGIAHPSCTTPSPTLSANCALSRGATGYFAITNHNYYSVGELQGYGYVYISPSTISDDSIRCDNLSFGSSETALCGAGTVPADCNYDACAGVGFHLNETTSGGDPNPLTSPAQVRRLTVTFVNPGGSDLRFKIAQRASSPDEGVIEYCYSANIESGTLAIAAKQFTTNCWNTGNPGLAWDGTGAQSFEIIIPSQPTIDTPFDVCIQDLALE